MLAERGITLAGPRPSRCCPEDSHMQRALARAGAGVAAAADLVRRSRSGVDAAQPGAPPLVTFPVWLWRTRELHSFAPGQAVFDALAAGLAGGV